MNDYVDCILSREVLDIMLIAQKISEEFQEKRITTLDVFLASLEYSDTILSELISEKRDLTDARLSGIANVVAIMASKSLYQEYISSSYDKFLESKKKDNISKKFVTDGIEKSNLDVIESYMLVMNLGNPFSQKLERALGKAQQVCDNLGLPAIDIDDLLYCIILDEQSKASRYIQEQYEISIKELKNDLAILLNLNELEFSSNKKIQDSFEKFPLAVKNNDILKIPDSLKNCIVNLNVKLEKSDNCDILGRDDEIFELWNIISKKTKRNVILVGKPGVGKSAIVEAITYSIVKGTCPKEYRNYIVLELNLNSMVAGTHYRGDFEGKVDDLIKFIESKKNLILFVDEIHQIIGAGNAEGSGPDFAGSIKPILARDDVVFIGATTLDEYNRIFSKDGALSRRFERVIVDEPKGNKLREMLKGRVKTLSEYHGVTCSKEILEDVIVFASSFSNVANPDRTIDLLDKSMAIAKIEGDKSLELKHIQKVYRHYFSKFDNYSDKQKKITAYHEAGHFVAWLLSKTKVNEKCTLISIVPAFQWQGVTMFDSSDKIEHSGTMQFLEDLISIGVAGRIGQQFVQKGIDTGASSDIQNLVSQVENYLLKCGMSDEFKNYSFNADSLLKITDEDTGKLRAKAIQLINTVYDKTEKKLSDNNKEGLDRVAKCLLEKKIITASDAKKAFYNKLNNKKEVQNVN